ncbi:MAG: hypothetical protein JWP44_3109 [Mucilaginibacter sp.]|nr:hypothetical protein [Mucilaginibacter sp.]
MSTVILKRHENTERKKAELDALTTEILDTQYQVEQYNAIVASLTEKSNNFQNFLAQAEINCSSALNNKNFADQLVQSALDLQSFANIAFAKITEAEKKTRSLVAQMKIVIGKVIYSAEVINKLANIVIRKKSVNPLISDELLSMLSTACNNANTAVSLTLVALKAAFAAQASNIGSEAEIALENQQSMLLYRLLTDTGANGNLKRDNGGIKDISIIRLLDSAYTDAQNKYDEALNAGNIITRQLNEAKFKLNQAEAKLKLLQSGLAAAASGF